MAVNGSFSSMSRISKTGTFEIPLTTQMAADGPSGFNITTTDVTSGMVDDNFYHGTSQWAKITALSLLPVVIILGLFGNGLVCRAVFRYQKLRCVANSLIVSLAVSDLAVCGVIMPFAAYQELTSDQRWHLGPVVCNIWVALDVLLCTASIWNMCVIALDRCMAITNPVWYVNRRTPLTAAFGIASAWGLSLLLSVMVLFLMGDNFSGSEANYSCQVAPSPAIAVVSASVTFYIPCFIVVALYIKIFLAARRHLRGKSIRAAISTMHAMRRPTGEEVGGNRSSSSQTHGDNSHQGPVRRTVAEATQEPHRLPSISIERSNVVSPSDHSSNNGRQTTNDIKRSRLSVGLSNDQKRSPLTLNVPDSSFNPNDGFSAMEYSDANDDLDPRSAKNSLASRPSCDRGGQTRGPRAINRISVTRERRAAAVLAVVIGVFMCCWLPFFIVYVIVGLCAHCHVTNVTFQVLTWLGWCNSILNPLIYTVFNLDFRHAFRKILLERSR